MYDGVDFIARTERISKKEAVNSLLELGMRTLYAEKIAQGINERHIAEDMGKDYTPVRFILEFRKWAKKYGMDIHKII
jgi:hypothetical protein